MASVTLQNSREILRTLQNQTFILEIGTLGIELLGAR